MSTFRKAQDRSQVRQLASVIVFSTWSVQECMTVAIDAIAAVYKANPEANKGVVPDFRSSRALSYSVRG